jgi:hypothetical protein
MSASEALSHYLDTIKSARDKGLANKRLGKLIRVDGVVMTHAEFMYHEVEKGNTLISEVVEPREPTKTEQFNAKIKTGGSLRPYIDVCEALTKAVDSGDAARIAEAKAVHYKFMAERSNNLAVSRGDYGSVSNTYYVIGSAKDSGMVIETKTSKKFAEFLIGLKVSK